MDDKQRFVDSRGWLRNRRAVVLDGAGITVERWIGQPVRLPWSSLRTMHWERTGLLAIVTAQYRLRLGRGVGSLAELARVVADTMAARAAGTDEWAVNPRDVRRYLRGFRMADVAPDHPEQTPTLLGACVVLGGPAGLAVAAHLCWRWGREPRLADPLLLVLWLPAGAAVSWLFYLALNGPEPPAKAGYRLEANDQRVVLTPSIGEVRSFAWSQIAGLEDRSGFHTVLLRDGRPVDIPKHGPFAPVIAAIRAVLEHRRHFEAEDLAVPDAALSRAERPAPRTAERGLTRADGSAQPEALDA